MRSPQTLAQPDTVFKSFRALLDAFNHSRAIKGIEGIRENPHMFLTLSKQGFENLRFELEAVHSAEGILFREILARPKTNEGADISIGPTSEEFYNVGLGLDFDQHLLARMARIIAEEYDENPNGPPFSINMSPQSMLSKKFWAENRAMLSAVPSAKLVFEILEHDVSNHEDASHLEALREQGFSFALDDFSGTPADMRRLNVFGDQIKFVKLDGPMVRAGLNDFSDASAHKHHQTDLAESIEFINRIAPHAKIICERVRSLAEIHTLKAMGIDGFQGRYLDKNLTPEQILSGENTNPKLDLNN